MTNEEYMQEALAQGRLALIDDEVPVGAIVVYKGQIIGRGYNQRQKNQQVCDHAEIIAIKQACQYLNCWHLDECSLYVTVEPCLMCAGTIIQARINEVYYGTTDKKQGAFGSLTDLTVIQNLNHYPRIFSGILEDDCRKLMNEFFTNLRMK